MNTRAAKKSLKAFQANWDGSRDHDWWDTTNATCRRCGRVWERRSKGLRWRCPLWKMRLPKRHKEK